MKITEGLSYDDVQLLPGFAEVMPGETDVSVELLPGMQLHVPILSAAMDTVTEAELATVLALNGGCGVIHRNLDPESQASEVRKVKRYLNWVIENPLTVDADDTVQRAGELMDEHGVSGLPVLRGGTLVGILTSRDMRFCRDYSQRVSAVMTPDPVVERGEPMLDTAQQKFDRHKIEKLPVVDDAGRLTGLITVKDMEKHRQFPLAATDRAGRLLVGAAVGTNEPLGRVELLAQEKVDFIVIDSAHGDSAPVHRAIRQIKDRFDLPVVGGNVATADGTRRLLDTGCDLVKVGVGPGSICTTRIVAGIGVPQFTAVADCAAVAAEAGVPVIADGGIRYSGDITKAIAAGAHAVMLGNLFAGLREAPGREVIFEGRIFKTYRGMGSIGAIKAGSGDRYRIAEGEDAVPEGVEGRVPYRGELKPYLHQLVTGLRKGMGYTGCRDLAALRAYQTFVKISSAGLRESHAHDVVITQEPPNYSR